MKTQSKQSRVILTDKSIKFNAQRARARARVNVTLGLCTASEAGLVPDVMLAPRGSSNWSATFGRGISCERRGHETSERETWRVTSAGLLSAADVADMARADREAGRADVAGLLSAAQISAIHRSAYRAEAERRAADDYLTAGRVIDSIRQTKKDQADAVAAARAEVVEAGGVLVPADSLGARVASAERVESDRAADTLANFDDRQAAALGKLSDDDRRAATAEADRARAAGILGAVEWASLTLETDRQRQRAARVHRVLSLGLPGKAYARALRIADAMGRRWLRQHSRREALALAEVGGAAGVDDLGAGRDWAAELMAVARAAHISAASAGLAMLAAPLAPCRELIARALSGGATDRLQLAILGRGRRIDGEPVIEWDEAHGRRVREDTIGTIGRGFVWGLAARQAGRDMHKSRYGLGGRDGREVGGGWTVSGSVSDLSALDYRVNPTRRPSFVASVRAGLALVVWGARRNVERARRDMSAAVSHAERLQAGSAIGAARRALSSAVDRARVIGRAVRGESLADVSAWVESDERGHRLTAAGRQICKRFRDDYERRAGESVRVAIPRAAALV